MPADHTGKYWLHGAYDFRTISRMTRSSFSRTCNSSRAHPVPYPTRDEMIARMDAPGDEWYSSVGDDLHLKDFLFQARMQTARRATQRQNLFPHRDRVLDRLIEEGTFDRRSPDTPDSREELSMGYTAALGQRLLVRIELLEAEVSRLDGCTAER